MCSSRDMTRRPVFPSRDTNHEFFTVIGKKFIMAIRERPSSQTRNFSNPEKTQSLTAAGPCLQRQLEQGLSVREKGSTSGRQLPKFVSDSVGKLKTTADVSSHSKNDRCDIVDAVRALQFSTKNDTCTTKAVVFPDIKTNVDENRALCFASKSITPVSTPYSLSTTAKLCMEIAERELIYTIDSSVATSSRMPVAQAKMTPTLSSLPQVTGPPAEFHNSVMGEALTSFSGCKNVVSPSVWSPKFKEKANGVSQQTHGTAKTNVKLFHLNSISTRYQSRKIPNDPAAEKKLDSRSSFVNGRKEVKTKKAKMHRRKANYLSDVKKMNGHELSAIVVGVKTGDNENHKETSIEDKNVQPIPQLCKSPQIYAQETDKPRSSQLYAVYKPERSSSVKIIDFPGDLDFTCLNSQRTDSTVSPILSPDFVFPEVGGYI